MATRRKMVSVYPDEMAAAALGGYASASLNPALSIFGYMLTRAKKDNEKALRPKDWEYLKSALAGRRLDYATTRIGRDVAAAAREWDLYHQGGAEVYGRNDKTSVEALAEKLEAMDDAHAWAVVWVAKGGRP